MTDTKRQTRYNLELLEQVRDVIADETAHDQSLWMRISRAALSIIPDRWTDRFGGEFIVVSCPTAACVAGWAASLTGGKMLVNAEELNDDLGLRQYESTNVLVGKEVRNVSNYAREQLGLNEVEADALFAAEWTNEEVIENLDDIIRAGAHGVNWDIRWYDDLDHSNDYDGGY